MEDISKYITPDALPSLLLIVATMALMRRLSTSGWSLALIGLIGTMLHEASHYVVGKLLFAKPVKVSLWPRKEGDYWVLGYVQFQRLNIFNSAFVAFAPLLLFLLGAFLFIHWLLPAYAGNRHLEWLMAAYVVSCCLSSGWPSATDFKVGFLSAVMYATAIYFLIGLAK